MAPTLRLVTNSPLRASQILSVLSSPAHAIHCPFALIAGAARSGMGDGEFTTAFGSVTLTTQKPSSRLATRTLPSALADTPTSWRRLLELNGRGGPTRSWPFVP